MIVPGCRNLSGRAEPCEHRAWANGRCLECGDVLPSVEESIRRVRLLALDVDGVLTSNDVWIDADGREMTRWWRGDGLGIDAVREAGIDVAVITGERGPALSHRLDKLGIELRSLGVTMKHGELWHWCDRLRIAEANVAYVGNDVNDAECLRAVGLPIVVADAHPDVLPLARYVTRARGGYGAVREVCDMIVKGKADGAV